MLDDITSSKSCLEQDLGPDNQSHFLEKYFYDLITDNCDQILTNTLYRSLIEQISDKKQLETILTRYIQDQIELQQRQKIHSKYFFAKSAVPFKKLLQQFRQLLIPEENVSHTSSTLSQSFEKNNKSRFFKNSDFIELYENQPFEEMAELNKGELIYIDVRFRITNSQLKDELYKIRSHILKQLLYQTNTDENFFQTFNDYYRLKTITVLLFVNGDINFDYEKYFDFKELQVGQKRFLIKLKVCYVSANRLYSNFCISNNIISHTITQQNMAFYELKRYGQCKVIINKTIGELRRMKQKSKLQHFQRLQIIHLSIRQYGNYRVIVEQFFKKREL
ncbi:unnamed protein product (macronuclear) [Paramecium tetraurelia]|uniref:Spindle pole body component n=1 Tax=Paramecium tetraurelia TaxID=5888 RepID=A0BUM6_PARTE|nr:uncharacterized protein GSPATT00005489001 [Paramecium tetraurelia]CAK62243.1 unnamed protein product [Paramecium tetraurelia]|eukprot:XP_001429641.1 hypothetical protein (macronuclear) [Paramecium tetraurelia strain d4-2]